MLSYGFVSFYGQAAAEASKDGPSTGTSNKNKSPAASFAVKGSIPLLGNLFISRFLVAGIIVWLMIYVIMPRYTRAVADWLYR